LDLSRFQTGRFDRGRPACVEALWLLVQGLFAASWMPGSRLRSTLLRGFGARLGRNVVLKPGLRVKFPWRLAVGDNSWLGENAWIDNLAAVTIGSNCCISQGAYLCTGNHDWTKDTFDLMTLPILVNDRSWIGAKAVVGPGVTVGEGAVLTIGSVAVGDLKPGWVYAGNPAVPVRPRRGNAEGGG
jgi:putative colanic acid biosynthesis acetyltransferase WcaF